MNRPGFLPVLVLLFLLAAKSHAALDVGKPLWGFDGKVPPNSFALLSVEIFNRGARTFKGDIELSSGGNGAPMKQSVFLAPGTSRIVQFHPYIGSFVPNWRLSWNDGSDRAEDMGQPQTGAPATVLLADPDAPGTRAVRMRLFAENLFPAMVGATNGLGAVVLDHQPHWDAARREAFLDWLRRGGTVHLLPGADGSAVQFSDDFAPMNIADGARQKRVGAGLIVKHDITRAEITDQWLKEHGFPAPELRTDGRGNIHDTDGFVFRKLAAITRPDINWKLIYLLTVAYVILIGPVFYVLRKRNYRLLLGGFLATVAVFAWMFTIIGRRGYGEKQIYHSIAIAHPLGAGRFDVQEWIHAFATTGDIYKFSHGDGGQLYGTASDSDTVRGEIHEGKASYFSADIPLFSSRPFLHRGVMKAEDPALKVEEWTENDSIKSVGAGVLASLKTFRVNAAPEFRRRVFTAVIERNGRYTELALTPGGFELPANASSKTAQEFFGKNQYFDYGRYSGSYYGDAESVLRELLALHPFFICLANGDPAYFRRYLTQPASDAGRVRLFLWADAPPGFAMKNGRFESGKSLVLYVADIFKL
ncbi:MAG: hypothetical protein ABI318_03940 [Chthoniobacteraceae bacterium]